MKIGLFNVEEGIESRLFKAVIDGHNISGSYDWLNTQDAETLKEYALVFFEPQDLLGDRPEKVRKTWENLKEIMSANPDTYFIMTLYEFTKTSFFDGFNNFKQITYNEKDQFCDDPLGYVESTQHYKQFQARQNS